MPFQLSTMIYAVIVEQPSKMKQINLCGAKNSALPLLAATILARNLYYFTNIPRISDVHVQINILRQFNVRVNWINNTACFIDTTEMCPPSSIDYSQNTRGTYYFIGSSSHIETDLSFEVNTGCEIDVRKIDFHLQLLVLLGKKVRVEGNKIFITGRYANEDIAYTFPVPSVGATINGLFMFVMSASVTTLHNYAKDPYITDVIKLLRSMGARIDETESSLIIYGSRTSFVSNTLIRHTAITDPIEALTYILFSAITLPNDSRSSYIIGPVNREHYGDAISFLSSVGITLEDAAVQDYCFIRKGKQLKSFNIETGYFPKIYTDIQPFICLLALFAEGTSFIGETIWSDRFKYAHEIVKMGYDIEFLSATSIRIQGCTRDHSCVGDASVFQCTDLRGGMAVYLLMRFLGLKNTLTNMKYIDRGYQLYDPIIDCILHQNVDYCSNYPTQHLSNIHIGGVVDMFVIASSESSLLQAISLCEQQRIQYKVIGGGNNVYFTERVSGMIIQNAWRAMDFDDGKFRVSSGALLFEFVLFASDHGYDISQLAGIPGTVGGAIYGNAGAYGLEIKDILQSCTVFDGTTIREVTAANMKLDYRTSYLKDGLRSEILLTTTFSGLPKSDSSISNIIKTLQMRAWLPSENTVGSVFRNKQTADGKIYAWKLLDEMGLRGQTKYGITMYPSHPNIWVNSGSASSSDFTRLIDEVVKQSSLELEIERIGEH